MISNWSARSSAIFFREILSRMVEPLRGQVNLDEAAILGALSFAHQPPFDGALHQSHHGVVASLQELGEFGDRGPAAARVARHSQQKLVLLGSDAASARHSFAESEETPQRGSETRPDAAATPCAGEVVERSGWNVS